MALPPNINKMLHTNHNDFFIPSFAPRPGWSPMMALAASRGNRV